MRDNPDLPFAGRAEENDASSVAVLFTDLVGSTEFGSRRGDEAAFEAYRRHRDAVESAVAGYGEIVKSTGDGLLVRFDDAATAVTCALDLRDRVAADVSGQEEWMQVRYGINVGPARVDVDDLLGLDVTAAARIVGKARAGQILVSEAVRDAAGASGAAFLDRGLFWLKGFPDRWRLYEAAHSEHESRRAIVVEGRTAFVGRENETAILRRSIDGVQAGSGRFVTLAGPRGVGKTRLALEMLDEAAARGLGAVRVNVHQSDRTDALRPIAELLDHARRSFTDARFREVLGECAADVARVVPELRERYTDIPELLVQPPDEARRSLFRSLLEVLGRLAATRPLVVLLDDLMWADATTIDFLVELAQDLDELQLLLLATYSIEDLSPTLPLHRALAELHRQHRVHAVDVSPFDRDAVEELLMVVGNAPPPPIVVDRLHRVTHGEAFYLEELLRHLDARDRMFGDDGSWLSDDGFDDDDLPESLRLVVEGRLLDLSEPARDLLVVAAVIGRGFSFDLLGEANDELDEETLVDLLDEVERAQLLSSVALDDRMRFLFSAHVVAEALLADLTPSRRQRLHLRVAGAIERVHASSIATHAAEIALHLESAGRLADPGRTSTFLRLAGERAMEACAFATALDHLDRSLNANRAMPAQDQAAVLEEMAAAERSLGHYDEAYELWEEAIESYEALGEPDEVARVCVEAAGQVGRWRRGGHFRAFVARGFEAIGDRDSPHAASLLAIEGGVASLAADLERGGAALREAVEIATRTGDQRALADAESALASHSFSICDFEGSVDSGSRAVTRYRARGDEWELANALGYVAVALGWLGRFEEAAARGEEAVRVSERLGNWAAYVFAEQAVAFRDVGVDPSAAVLQRRGEQLLDLGEKTGFPWLATIGLARIGLANVWRGNWRQALRDFDASVVAERRSAGGGHAGQLPLLHAMLGDADTALRMLDRASEGFAVLGRPTTGTAWTLSATALETHAILGRRDDAAALYPTIAAHVRTGSLMRSWDYRLLETLCGVASGAGGEWATAREHFARARQQARELPLRIEAAEVERLAALVLLDGPAEVAQEARHRLSGAIELYEDLGMAGHAAAARQLLVG